MSVRWGGRYVQNDNHPEPNAEATPESISKPVYQLFVPDHFPGCAECD